MIETSVDKILTQEEFEIMRDRSIELGSISGLVGTFFNRETETPIVGVMRLLRDYYQLMSKSSSEKSDALYYKIEAEDTNAFLLKMGIVDKLK